MIIEDSALRTKAPSQVNTKAPQKHLLNKEELKLIQHVLRFPLLEGANFGIDRGGEIAKLRTTARLQIPALLSKLAPELAEAWCYGYSHGLSESRISEMLHLYLQDLPNCLSICEGDTQ
jgi:DNA-directed RNA polymerase specialized sigma24 family protein